MADKKAKKVNKNAKYVSKDIIVIAIVDVYKRQAFIKAKLINAMYTVRANWQIIMLPAETTVI